MQLHSTLCLVCHLDVVIVWMARSRGGLDASFIGEPDGGNDEQHPHPYTCCSCCMPVP